MKDIVLFYHAKCSDGFGAAYAFWCKFKDQISYVPLEHFKRVYFDIEACRGKTVFMVDISLDREAMLALKRVAKELIVLDHHKSAQLEIGDLDFCLFDMNSSGAILAWNYLFNTPAPLLLQCVQDRDLWSWKIPHSEEILLCCDSFDKSFDNWDKLRNECDSEYELLKVIEAGTTIKRYAKNILNDLFSQIFKTNIKGYFVPIINTPLFRNDIISIMAKNQPFAAGYHFNGDCYIFSLRSDCNGIDVSEIASYFPGGGGHFHSAGFVVRTLEELK